MSNPGPASQVTVNTESPRGFFQFVQTISVAITPTQIATAQVVEQSYGANGATYATAATGILAGDVILAVSPPSTAASCAIAGWRVDTATADKFYIAWNTTASTITPPSGQYLITVGRYISSVSTTPGTLSSLPSSVVTAS